MLHAAAFAHLRQAGVMRDAPRVRRYRRGAPSPEDYSFGMIRPITANRDPLIAIDETRIQIGDVHLSPLRMQTSK